MTEKGICGGGGEKGNKNTDILVNDYCVIKAMAFSFIPIGCQRKEAGFVFCFAFGGQN